MRNAQKGLWSMVYGFGYRKPNHGLVAYGLLVLILAGCATTSTSRSSKSDPTQIPSLEPAAMMKLADVPVPASFIFIPESSYAFQSADFRAGLLRYRGRAAGDQAVVFFKEQMPMYNWRLINIVEYGRRILTFEKDEESCVITIDGKDNNLEAAVSVGPKSQAVQQRRTDKPIK